MIALSEFMEVVDGWNDDLSPLEHFTCPEVNALATLLGAWDRNDERAALLVYTHIGDDEDEDEIAAHVDDYPVIARLLADGDGGTINDDDIRTLTDR